MASTPSSPIERPRDRSTSSSRPASRRGNASIEADGIYIHVEGRPPTDLTRAARIEFSRGWAARPTGLQVLFALLTRPDLLEAKLTDIAHVAGVSTTTAHRVLADLTSQGLLGGESMGRFWLDRDGALRAWREGYTRVVAVDSHGVDLRHPHSAR